MSYYNFCDFTFKKVPLRIQRHWLMYEIDVKSQLVRYYLDLSSSILMVFVILIENNDVLKLSIYIGI